MAFRRQKRIIIVLCVVMTPFLVLTSLALETDHQAQLEGKALIRKLQPLQKDGAGGGYELTYLVDAPPDAFWKFKTDFDNDFITTNKFIIAHQLVRHKENVVVTEAVFSEDLYTHRPKAKFRWQTTLFPDQYRLEFLLLNPEECGQKFHHGSIQLEAIGLSGQKTKVTQKAYFDFFGVSFWLNYPWYGGMKDFLTYSARWEQTTFSRLKAKYIQKSAQ
jgi:hypothetical protein